MFTIIMHVCSNLVVLSLSFKDIVGETVYGTTESDAEVLVHAHLMYILLFTYQSYKSRTVFHA